MTNPNDPATPFFKYNKGGYGNAVVIDMGNGITNVLDYEEGLSKRELFASMFLQGFISSGNQGYADNLANKSVHFADELIKALNKEK